MLEILPFAYLCLDKTGRILEVNERCIQQFKVDRHDIYGKRFHDLMDPSCNENLKGFLAELATTGSGSTCVTIISCKGNSLIISINGKAEFNCNGEIVKIHFIMDNDNNSNELEKIISNKEGVYKIITDNISDVVWIKDLNLKTIFVSPSVEKVFGETPEEHLAKSFEQKHPKDSVEKLRSLLNEELQKEKDPKSMKNNSRVVDVQRYHADGHLMWVSINITFIRNRNGNIIGIQGVTRDITELKEAEESLKRSEAMMRSVFNLAPAGIGIVKNRILTAVNPAMCTMLGFSRDELINKSSRMIYPSQDEFEYVGREKYRQIEQCGQGIVETKWIRKEGKQLDILLSSSPIDQNNRSEGVMFVALDITEKKEAEQQVSNQLKELQRWHETTIGREMRIIDLKTEVNSLLMELGRSEKYTSVI